MKKILTYILTAIMLVFGLTACQELPTETESTAQKNTIEFVDNELELDIGESVQAEVITSKKNVFVFWSIRDSQIASVTQKGVITALATGETVCYAEFGGEVAMCLVKVREKTSLPELSVSVPYYNNQVSMYADSELNLKAMAKLGDAVVTDATFEYVVENADVAVVEDGVLQAKALGETTVTIKATYNGQTAELVVNVQVINKVKDVRAIIISGQETTFVVGDKFAFGGTVSVEYVDGTQETAIDYYTIDTSNFDGTRAGTYEIVVSVGDARQTYTVAVNKLPKSNTLKLLMIGNSFSQDTVMWMPQIAKSMGYTNYVIATIIIGGCTLETHYNNSKTNAANYEFLYASSAQEGWTTETGKTLQYGLRFADWDFISLQQQSGNSGNPATYNSDLDGLIAYVKSMAIKSNVKLVWNMTWAYPSASNWFGGLYDNSQAKMYNAIVSTVQDKIATNENFCLISPAGTAIQNGRTSYMGDSMKDDVNAVDVWNRDGAHLSQYEGRYTSSLSMFCTLTGYSPDEVTYQPANVDNKEFAVIRESVKNALSNMYSVTQSAYID